jgi:hypothetical protein
LQMDATLKILNSLKREQDIRLRHGPCWRQA